MRNKRMIAALAATAIVSVSCEAALNEATIGMDGEVSEETINAIPPEFLNETEGLDGELADADVNQLPAPSSVGTWTVREDGTGPIWTPPASWYPDERGVLLQHQSPSGGWYTSWHADARPDGFDPTGPREDSQYHWYQRAWEVAPEGSVWRATGHKQDGTPFVEYWVAGQGSTSLTEAPPIPTESRIPFRPGQPLTTAAPAPTTTAAPAPTTTAAPAPTTTAAPAPTTTAPAPTTTAPAPTTTAAPAPTTTAAPAPTTTAAPTSPDGRQVIDMSSSRGTVVLDRANTIYDFGNVSASRDITIAASNVEARNIRGSGARRIGERDGKNYVDSGFRDFEFTYMQTRNGGGGDIIRPYFINGMDVNPQPNVGDGSIVHIYAYQGDIIDPLIENVTVYGKKRPSGSSAHNDGIHFTSTTGSSGRVVNPTVRNSTIYSGSAFAVLARHTYGTLTLEGNTFVERYTAYHAVMGDARDVSSTVTLLWRNNSLDGSAVFVSGYRLHANSDLGGADITVQG